MSATVKGQFEKSIPMNAISDISTVNRFTKALEDSEARRLGINTATARERIAQRIGISPSTLHNLRRLRTKVVPNWLMEKVRSELVAVLQLEIARLEHEIQLARQTGLGNRDDALIAAETQLAKARETLMGEVK